MKKRIGSWILTLAMVCVCAAALCGEARAVSLVDENGAGFTLTYGTDENGQPTVTKNSDAVITFDEAWAGTKTPGSIVGGSTGKNIYLSADTEFLSYANISYTVRIDLAGHTLSLKGNSSNYGLTVPSGSTLEIYDSSATGTGKILCESNANKLYNLIQIEAGGTLKLYGGTIDGNGKTIQSDKKGGAVYLAGTFHMYGGAIQNGKVATNKNGGGVYVDNGGVFHMTGGTISGCTASNGGGVYVDNGGTLNLSGSARIEQNTVTSNGGGVYVGVEDALNISGTCVIEANTKSTAANNVYLPSSKTITVNGALTNGAHIGVTLATVTGAITSGYASSNSADPDTYFFADNGKVIDWNNGKSEAELTTNDAHTHTDANGNTVIFKKWTYTNSLPATAGNYYLTDNVTLDSTWSVPNGTTNLCLNGKSITLTADTGSVINVGSTAALNLYDESGATDTHTITSPVTNAEVTIKGGLITGGKGTQDSFHIYGGGVYMKNGSTFGLYGGTIAGNTVTGGGGGVYMDDGATPSFFRMSGGSITDNTSDAGGGVYVGKGWTLDMSGGKIACNKDTGNGAGVYVGYGDEANAAKLILSGDASIENNIANGSGGGVYLDQKGRLTLSGSATIKENKAQGAGGGVCVMGDSASMTMTGGSITGNESYGSGDNMMCGGGVYVSGEGEFAMSGGSITNNTSDAGGGVFVNENGTFKVSGAVTIKDNRAGTANWADKCFASPTASNVGVVNYIWRGDTYKSVITIDGVLSKTDPIGVTAYAPGEDEDFIPATDYPIPFTGGGTTYKNCFTPDNNQLEIIESGDNLALALFHTVTFNNGGGIAVGQKKILHGEKITESETTTTRTGYTFDGWYKDSNYQTSWNFGTDTVTSDVTLYAKWTTTPAVAPTVTAANVTMTYGDSGKSVSVTATPAAEHTITGYQWYSNTTDSNTGGTTIDGATESSYALTGMNTGTYYYYCVVTVKRADNNQTTTATSNAVTVTVNRKDISLGNCSYHFPDLRYDGTEKTIHFETLQIGDDYVTEGVDYTLSGTTTGKDAGGYTGLIITGKGNYTGTRNFALSWTIYQREATLTWSDTTFTYDGAEKCPTATVSNLVSGDTCNVTVTGAQTNAGTYTATATALDNSNYRLPSTTYNPNANSKSFTIGQKEAALSWDQLNFTYDGTEKCPAATVSNLESGDTCTVTVTGGITNAGSGTATATALSNSNYKLPSANSISFSVVKASQAAPTNAPTAASTTTSSITLTATDGYEYKLGDGAWQTSNVFTGLDMNTEYTFYQRVAGDANHNPSNPSPAASISTANHVHSWSYSADGAVLTATCADTDNGHGATKTATLTISATGKTYDGTAVTATVSGSIDGVTTPSIVYKQGNTELTEAPKDAGTYTANITLGGATASVEFTIDKATLTVTAGSTTITYGNAPTNDGVTYSGFVNGETSSVLGGTLTYDYSYAQYGDVGGSYTITPKGLTSGNYNIAYVNGTLTVSKKDITISGITAADKTYNGTTAATLSYDGVSFGGVVNGDELTVSATGAFADKNVGTDKAVTISDLSLSGAKAGNYQLAGSGQQASTTANITAREITVSGITAESKVYDGNTTATLNYSDVTLEGKVGSDNLSVTATGTFDSAAKGTDKTVTISGLALTGTDAGNYILATEGQQTTTTANITGAATLVTTVPTASPIVYGQTLGDSTLTGGAADSVPGTFSWAVPSTAPAVSDSGVTEYDVTFTPTDAENYAPSTCTVTLTVNKATPTIATNPTASEIGYGQTLAASTLTGGTAENPYNHAAVVGTFAWTDTTTAPAKTDSNSTAYSVIFTPTDTANYNAATTTITLTVNKAALSPAPTVTMSGYTYGNTPSTPSVSSNPESTTVTYYYSTVSFLSSDPDKTAPTMGTEWTGSTSTTLNAGTYFMCAVLAESANYAQYVTAQTTFTVSQAQYAAPTAPTVSGYTVTIAEADREKRLEYAVVTSGSAAPTTYAPVPTLSVGGTFTLSGLAKETNYTVYLRERASANGNYKASDAINTSWTTPTEWTVVYNANRGTGTVPATQNGTGVTPVTVASGSGLTRTGYAFGGWNTAANGGGTSYAAGASISDGATLYAQWTPNSYTVKFNANGGTGTMTDEDFTYDTAQALTANTFTHDGYTFAGWSTSAGGPVLYGNGQNVKNLAVSGSVTLYAVWTQNTYAVSGSVTSGTNSTATVKLMQGNAQFATQSIEISSGSGSYNFTGVPAGTYNLVIARGDQTVTEIIIITSAGVTRNITIPTYKTSSVLEVKGEDTPPVVVGGLNNEAASKAEESKIVTITMTVEKQEAQQLPETATEAEQETQDAIEAIESAASSSDGVEYMNITVQKEVKSGSTTESTETLTTTNTVMEIVIPYDMDGKKNIKVYRHHDGTAAELTKNSNKTDGTYQVDTANGLIYLYANQFSTYAIAYEVGSDPVTPPTPPAPPTPSFPSGGGTSYYTITVAGTEGGTVTTDHKTASRGATVTLTVTANNGFQLASLTVANGAGNNISLTRAGDKYTFSMPSSNVTVTAAFAPKSCAQDDTCPISAFTDADPTAWYHDGVHYVLENGIMSGYGGVETGSFGPNDKTSRAMMAQILWNMDGKPVVNYLLTYSDVAEGMWYTGAVRWVTAEGIMNGYGDDLFGPDDAMTREQLVTIVHRYAIYKGVDVSVGEDTNILSYDDAFDVSEWAIPAMQWAVGSGAVGGRTNTTLNPKDDATRAEIATIVMRYCTEIAK